MPKLKIISANHSDAGVTAISFKKLGAEFEKRWVRECVILKYNAFFYVLKKPIDCSLHCSPTSKVLFAVESRYLTWPIDDLLNEISRLLTSLAIGRMSWSRSISCDVQSRRPYHAQ